MRTTPPRPSLRKSGPVTPNKNWIKTTRTPHIGRKKTPLYKLSRWSTDGLAPSHRYDGTIGYATITDNFAPDVYVKGGRPLRITAESIVAHLDNVLTRGHRTRSRSLGLVTSLAGEGGP